MTSAFNEMHPNDQRKIIDAVEDFVGKGAVEREQAADERHAEIVGWFNLFAAAAAAGARAFADTLDRGPRRR